MGWSCRKEQSETLDLLFDNQCKQEGYPDLKTGQVFIESPRNGVNYGNAGDHFENMSVPVMQIIEGGLARKIATISIAPNGEIVAMSKTVGKRLQVEHLRRAK